MAKTDLKRLYSNDVRVYCSDLIYFADSGFEGIADKIYNYVDQINDKLTTPEKMDDYKYSLHEEAPIVKNHNETLVSIVRSKTSIPISDIVFIKGTFIFNNDISVRVFFFSFYFLKRF